MAKNNNKRSKVSVGVGLGMIVAGLASVYYLYGTKEGSKKRVKIRGWALKAKGEMLEKLENLKEVNEKSYNELVANVMKKYTGLKNIDQKEVHALVDDFKKHWKSIKKHINTVNKPKTKVKKSVKKSTNKQ